MVSLLDVVEIKESYHGFGGRLSPIFLDWSLGEYWLPRLFSGLLVISRGLEEMYRERCRGRLIVVPAIECWDLGCLASAAQKDKGSRVVFVYVGSLTPRDAPEHLREILRELDSRGHEFELRLIGDYMGTDNGRRFVREVSRDPRLVNRIVSLGWVSDQELKHQLLAADALLLTRRRSRKEECAFPTRLAEYLTTGRPVCVASVGDIPLYLENGLHAIVFSPDDPHRAADAISELITKRDLGAEMGLNGFRRGAECFNREVHARRVLDFAERIHRPPQPSGVL